MKIPLCKPAIGEEEKKLVMEVLDSGWLAEGQKNKLFEEEFAKYIGTNHAISLNSCTSALQLAMIANSLKGEVILPSFTFIASANSIATSSCKPVFADIDYDTCNISPEEIRNKITKKTVAIMPVHYAGQSCIMDEVMEIAEKHGLVVIEDSAECIGGTFKGKKTGSFGIGCFSFYPTKNMTTGEGGMITTDDTEFAAKARALRGHGVESSAFQREKQEKPWFRSATYSGFNYRLCDVLAAIGLVQLKKLDSLNEKRREHAQFLNKQLSSFEELELPLEAKNCKHVYQMYTIRIKQNSGVNRTEFVKNLREKGIGASVHFEPPAHLQKPYISAGYKKGMFPVTEKVSKSIVTLPMYPELTHEQLSFIVTSIEEVL